MDLKVLDTTCSLRFVIRDDMLYEKEKPYVLRYEAVDIPQSNIKLETVENIPISQMRTRQLSLDQNGIQLLRFESSLQYGDFEYTSQVERVFFSEIRDLLRRTFKTQDVYIFDWALRRRDPAFPALGHVYTSPQPIPAVHIGKVVTGRSYPNMLTNKDFSPNEIERRIRQLFGDQAETLLKRRHRVLNTWKPLKGPVRDWPLAVCDAATVNVQTDLLEVDDVLPSEHLEVLNVHYNPQHEWYYVPDQQVDELLIFSAYDSHHTQGMRVPHCSFPLKDAEENVQPRESIEVRLIVFED